MSEKQFGLHPSFRGTRCALGDRVSLSRHAGLALWTVANSVGCGSLPLPPAVPPPEADFVEVPAPPPPARVEIVSSRPNGARFWIDGSWMWEGSRWKWTSGGWFAPPAGVQYVDWRVIRRDDGTLLYANAMWLDAHGAPTNAPAPIIKSPPIGGGSDEEKPPPTGEGADQKPPPPGQPTEPSKPNQVLGRDNPDNGGNGKKP